jgi:outer membrane protein TolC
MSEAMAHNLDVQSAESRIRQARASWRAAQAGYAPEVTLGAGWTRSRTSQHLTRRLLPSTLESYYDGRLSGTWTVDLFGQIRKTAEAQRALYQAARAEREVVMLTLSKEVAVAYFSMCAMQQMVQVVSHNITSQQEIVRLTQVRYEAGLESQLDVAQALSTLHNTEAGITTYRSSETAYRTQLAVLLGTTPGELAERFAEPIDTLPAVNIAALRSEPGEGGKPLSIGEGIDPLSIGEGIDTLSIAWSLLRRRPDLRQEEWLIDQQSALLGVAHKAWLPTVLIEGDFGVMAHESNRWMRRQSFAWQVSPVVQWTVFNGGARCADVRRAKAQLQEQIDAYNRLLLTAAQQVESSAVAYRQGVQQVASLRAAVQQAELSLQLSVELYKMGLTAFINVMQAQQSVLQYQTALVSARNATLQQAVALWVALSDGSMLGEAE